MAYAVIRGATVANQISQEMFQFSRTARGLLTVPAQIASTAAPMLTRLIRSQIDAGTDPYGKRQAPLAASTLAKGRRPPPLVATGASRDETRFKARPGAGVALYLGGWLPLHQSATKHRPARPVAPRGPLPPAWRKAIEDAGDKVLKRQRVKGLSHGK